MSNAKEASTVVGSPTTAETISSHNSSSSRRESSLLRHSSSRHAVDSSSSRRISTVDARKALQSQPVGVRSQAVSSASRRMVQEMGVSNLIFPWMPAYKAWWTVTLMGAILTVFYVPYVIAFHKDPGTFEGGVAVIEYSLIAIFTLDMMVNFNLAFYENEGLVLDRRKIARNYCRGMFWIDLLGIFPLEVVAINLAGEAGSDSNRALYLSLFRLMRLLRLHRFMPLFNILQYNGRISLWWFTLGRDYIVVMIVTHFAACVMYYLARLYDFDETTWLGPLIDDLNGLERYTTSLYWSIVTFTTVGYGDFSPVNYVEQIFGMIFMLLNVIVMAWVIGSITLLIVKTDEKTGAYRDALETLNTYTQMHGFDKALAKSLKTQLRLDFHNQGTSDETILKNFPSAVRRKILRRLYLDSLLQTSLMTGIRQAFVDSFLSACTVEIFSPGEEILERGSISSELFLLVGGLARVTSPESTLFPTTNGQLEDDEKCIVEEEEDDFVEDSGRPLGPPVLDGDYQGRNIGAGEFIGEIGFFTDSPAVETVSCVTVCKTLTMTRSAYKLIADEHPGSVGRILQNLLTKVQDMALELPSDLAVLRAGSVYDPDYAMDASRNSGMTYQDQSQKSEVVLQMESLTKIQDLVKMHMSKQLDDHTTRFLFAASRGDTATISLMCDQGFDANNADYDRRTALMVASMKGNTDVVKTLLDYKANPNLADVHGSTALYEAVKNGHEKTIDLLLENKAELCMEDSLAASILCQAVFEGDILCLKRLLRARIQVDVSDYDQRTAAHIAAAEGNVVALKALVEYGADLTLRDRWGNTVQEEAERSQARRLMTYLKEHQEEQK